MLKNGKMIYGTLRECTEELWKTIDFYKMKFNDFDFAACCDEGFDDINEAKLFASAWFGCKDLGKAFCADAINLMFGYYGGGGVESMELRYDDEAEKQTFMQRIGSCTDMCGYGVLEPDDYTLFHLR